MTRACVVTGDDAMIIAYLHPPIRKTGVPHSGRYAVSVDGQKIVANSRDPETDLARALIARGITGMVKLLDADTGKHRSTLNIEKAAKVTVREDRARGPCFTKWRPMPETLHERGEGQPPAGESDLDQGQAQRASLGRRDYEVQVRACHFARVILRAWER